MIAKDKNRLSSKSMEEQKETQDHRRYRLLS